MVTRMGHRVHLFFGEDELPAQEASMAAIEGLLPEQERIFGLETVEGRVDDSDAASRALTSCRQALLTVGFLSRMKVVWLKNANFLSDAGLPFKRGEHLLDEIQSFARWMEKGIPDGCVLVITAASMDKRQVLYRVCEKIGVIREFSLPDKPNQVEADVRGRTAAMLEQAGMRMDSEAMEVFVSHVSSGTRQISSEVEKLILYAGDKKVIVADDVKQIVSPSRETLVWDLTDAVAKKRLGQALAIVRQLLSQKESAIGLVVVLANRFRDLTIVREALDKGWATCQSRGRFSSVVWKEPTAGTEKVLAELPSLDPRKMNPWRVGFLAEQANLFTAGALARCRTIVADMHAKLVSSRMAEDVVLEVGILRLIGSRKRHSQPVAA